MLTKSTGFWHFYSRFPDNQRLIRLHNFFKRCFYILLHGGCLPGQVTARRQENDGIQQALTTHRLSFLAWHIVNGFSALPSQSSV